MCVQVKSMPEFAGAVYGHLGPTRYQALTSYVQPKPSQIEYKWLQNNGNSPKKVPTQVKSMPEFAGAVYGHLGPTSYQTLTCYVQTL